jgi:TonB-dependent starch-binding outer membrane protein SusC
MTAASMAVGSAHDSGSDIPPLNRSRQHDVAVARRAARLIKHMITTRRSIDLPTGCRVGLFLAGFVIGVSSQLPAQSPAAYLQLADRGPTFYRSVGAATTPIDVKTNVVLQRQIAVDLQDATIADAVAAVAHAAHVSVVFSNTASEAASAHRVTLQASKISVAGAMTAILVDLDMDVEVSPQGALTLVSRARPAKVTPLAPTVPGERDSVTVSGVVTDVATHAALSGAVVELEGTSRIAVTNLAGHYTISHLARGSYTMVTRRLGYLPQRHLFVVDTAVTYSVSFALAVSAAQLDQVITTVTGEQQKGSVGNSIALINADSVVKESPVTNMTDILNARAAGVQVINPGGLTGAAPAIYIRGASSLNLSTQPLVYIDGVRVSNTSAVSAAYGTFGVASGRLDDIPPDEIASIEVVRGPSASTLYGTDAANGVIVITTKRGLAGPPQWSMHVEGGVLTADPEAFPYNYSGWGTTTAGGQVTSSCTLLNMAAGACTQDSVTKFNPMRVPSLTALGTGNREAGGLQVSGGNQSLRYFVSGDYTNELGYIKIPTADQELLDSLLGPTANGASYRQPNALTKYGARTNVSAPLARNADIAVSASYLSTDSRIPNQNLAYLAGGGNGYRDQYDGWLLGLRPVDELSQQNNESDRRFTGSATEQWRPWAWLVTRMTTGVDLSADQYISFTPTAASAVNYTAGTISDINDVTTMYSVDLGATATLPVNHWLTSRLSVGAQYHRTEENAEDASANNLPIGGTSVSAGIPTGSQTDKESVVAGVYAEEQFELSQRLFLTGAVRVDGANDFGSNFSDAVYPKGSASWLISQEPLFPHLPFLSALRLRAAYGESGTQPGEVLTTLVASQVEVDGQTVPGLTLGSRGNPNIQPERQAEFETGADIDLVPQRIHAEFTYYSKRNTNALYGVPQAASVGGGTLEENVGTVWNWGYEALVGGDIVRTRPLTWDVDLNGSINHNQVVQLGKYFEPSYGSYGTPSILAGYPIYSWFAQPYTYDDSNNDGILEPSELTVSSKQQYYGQSIPPIQLTLGTHITLFHWFRVSALFDYRGGFLIPNQYGGDQCLFGTAYASVSRSASIRDQAACVAYNSFGDNRGLLSNGSFIRFRELALTFIAPHALASQIHASTVSLTLEARNLALWTHFTGGDPETPNELGSPADGLFQTGGGLPPAQYWLARLNITF